MVLQMADRSTKKPYCVVEDVVAQIDKLKFPVDFVVTEMGEDFDTRGPSSLHLGPITRQMARQLQQELNKPTPEDLKIPLILGRPFMKTAKVLINVDDGVLVLKDQDEEVIFNVFNDEQSVQVKKTSPKVVEEDPLVISPKAAKPDKGGKNCFFSQASGGARPSGAAAMEEDDDDDEDEDEDEEEDEDDEDFDDSRG
ncbi:histone chaperone ASF1-like [Vigna radiata var. radiata]|uniref:Histone chaperone ASF1-like n=1 Tax=Vigna radiata var. radiata TaxID=3916 RepID=A0A1S3VNU9_VIGRR|nr:histone chaperone ASF1-like [Vigna radiata var. radiata]